MGLILSIDASTKSTGWAIFETDDQNLVDYNCITATSTDLIKRIQKMVEGLEEIFEKYPSIEKIILEEVRPDVGHTSNPKTFKALMYLQAAFMFLLHEQYPKVEVEFLYPSSWRAKCGIHTGRGIKRQTLKQADIDFVKQQYGINVNDDIADAVCIGHSVLNEVSEKMKW
jgi:Holliday junction resolvasome RuvABC endonuclease subunit